jgi:hypothetical protein
MSTNPHVVENSLALFGPPYEHLAPCGAGIVNELNDVDVWKGRALIWVLSNRANQVPNFEALRCRPPGLPLFVLLPPPAEIRTVVDMLPLVRYLAPRMVLPHGLINTPYRLRQVLASPPRAVATALTEYLIHRGLLRRRRAVREFQRIVELAPEVRSISTLSRRMYTSRRTLGRHFISTGMRVPFHCLHFVRLFYVALQLQVEEIASGVAPISDPPFRQLSVRIARPISAALTIMRTVTSLRPFAT